MGTVTVWRPRFATAAILILAFASACSGPAASTKPPNAASASTAPVDLSNALIQPAGFVPVPNDVASGPLQTPDDVRRFFTDRPSDPGEILGHGFAGGYVQEWQLSQGIPSNANTVPEPTILLEIVIQFDSAAHAVTVEQYFRHAPQASPVTYFAVPPQLAPGYGAYQVQGSGTLTDYLYSAAWVHRNRLFDVEIGYPARQKSHAQVVSIAVAQNRASS